MEGEGVDEGVGVSEGVDECEVGVRKETQSSI